MESPLVVIQVRLQSFPQDDRVVSWFRGSWEQTNPHVFGNFWRELGESFLPSHAQIKKYSIVNFIFKIITNGKEENDKSGTSNKWQKNKLAKIKAVSFFSSPTSSPQGT